jgi:hypothetical protein
MRILGWVLLIGGLLLCASVGWAAPGFLFMGFGLIFLQIAEQKRRRAKSVASGSERTESQHEPPPLQELARALVHPKADEEARENVDRANATEVRDLRFDHAHDPISVSYLREIDAALKKVEAREDVDRANAAKVRDLRLDG